MPARMVGQMHSFSKKLRVNQQSTDAQSSTKNKAMVGMYQHFVWVVSAMVFVFPHLVMAYTYQPPIKKNRDELIKAATPEELEAAQGIEAIMVNMMLQEMRKTIHENELMPASHAEKIYKQMLDDEYAKSLAKNQGLGFAELVLEQFQRSRRPLARPQIKK